MNNTTICGIPVTIVESTDSTEVIARWSNLTPIQARLIKGWLEYKGNVVVSSGDTIKVVGMLKPDTIKKP